MKVKIYVIFVLILCCQVLFGQTFYMWTPNEKGVTTSVASAHQPSPNEYEEFQDDIEFWDAVVLIDCDTTQGTYNCHFYAWHSNQGHEPWSNTPPSENNYWMNSEPTLRWMDGNYVSDFYSDTSYSSNSSEASWISTIGSDAAILLYTYSGTSIPAHSARILDEECISKWGKGGLVRHDPDQCPWGDEGDFDRTKYKFNPDYREVRTDHDPMFSNIEDALSDAPSNCLIYVDNNSFSNVDNLSVQSGRTLQIASGATLSFASGKEVTVNGTLTANGATFQGQSGGYSYWDGIWVNSNCSVTGCTIKNAGVGITANNCNAVTIQNNDFITCTNGINGYAGSSSTTISGNDFNDMDGTPIVLVSTPFNVTSNTIDDAGSNAITVINPTATGDIDGNFIESADESGILLYSSASPVIKNNDIDGCSWACIRIDLGAEPTVSPNNTIRRTGTYSVLNHPSNDTVDATNNTWYNMLNYGDVNTSGGDFNKPAVSPPAALLLLEQGKNYFNNNNKDMALNVFRDLLINHNDSKYARKSFYYIMKILESKKENRLNNIAYFKDIKFELDNRKTKNEMNNLIEMHILYWLQRNKLYDEIESK